MYQQIKAIEIASKAKVLEFIGAITGIIGALMMAIDASEYALIAFSVWLISSVCLGIFAYLERLQMLLLLQTVFILVNLLGIFRNL